MPLSVKQAMFFSFIAGFFLANSIAAFVLDMPTGNVFGLFIPFVIMLAVAIVFYKKFFKAYDAYLKPTVNGWRK